MNITKFFFSIPLIISASALLLAACQVPNKVGSPITTQPTIAESVDSKNDVTNTAEQAPFELAKQVRESITVADSLIRSDEQRYQIHVLLGNGNDLVPVQVQVVDPKEPDQLFTIPLSPIDHKSCAALLPHRGRSTYETKWVKSNSAIIFALTNVKEVTIIVKSNGKYYSIENIPVSGTCMAAVT